MIEMSVRQHNGFHVARPPTEPPKRVVQRSPRCGNPGVDDGQTAILLNQSIKPLSYQVATGACRRRHRVGFGTAVGTGDEPSSEIERSTTTLPIFSLQSR